MNKGHHRKRFFWKDWHKWKQRANHEKAKCNNAEVNKTGFGLFKLSTENKGGVFYGMCFHANE